MSSEMKTIDSGGDTVLAMAIDAASSLEQPFSSASSLLPPPLPANLQEEERSNIMANISSLGMYHPFFIQRYYDESVDEYTTRVFNRISDLLRGDYYRVQGINYCIHYEMITTLNYALTELVSDPTVLDVPNELSPLYTAIHNVNVPAVTLLLEKGVSANVPRFVYDKQWSPVRDDWSPLMFALYWYSYENNPSVRTDTINEVAMLLIRHGCDINHQSEKSVQKIHRNALTIAAYQNNWPLVSYLLEYCDDGIKEGVLGIYKYGIFMRPDLRIHRLVDWNEIKYRRTIGRIREVFDALPEEISQIVIDFLGYSIPEMVSI